MQKNTISLLSIILISLTLCSCTTIMGKNSAKERELWASWGEQNKRQNEALGLRIYDKKFDLVFSSIIIAMADTGFSVKNMERMSGYILAEGPVPLSAAEEARLGKGMIKELNRVSPYKWELTPGNAKHVVTITVLRMGNGQTKVKMRIAVADIKGNYKTTYSSIYPPILEEEYKIIWRAIDRQIFLDENMD